MLIFIKIRQASLINKIFRMFHKYKDIYFNEIFLLKLKILTAAHPDACDLATRHTPVSNYFHFLRIYIRLQRIM